MSYLFKCERIAAYNGDTGLVRLDHIPGLDERVYRACPITGGMEYAMRDDFNAWGWKARTYYSLLDPGRFHVTR
jgi:hypothetical protein